VTRIAPNEPPAKETAKPAATRADEKQVAATPATPAKQSAKERGARDSDGESRREKARDSKRRADKSSARDGRKQRSADRESTKQRRRTAQAEARSATRGDGFLTVNAEPYATLYVDGKKLGVTPVVRLVLPPGAHRLRLVSSSGQPDKKMRVKIVAGQELRKFVKW
jgi:eukaryotic-like serine/threonine-protein kinase